jgi:hypothetical protein
MPRDPFLYPDGADEAARAALRLLAGFIPFRALPLGVQQEILAAARRFPRLVEYREGVPVLSARGRRELFGRRA